jgi:nitroreductase/dihydropteridine reductase
MDKDITHYAKTRHSAKAFDPNKKISATDIEKVKELLRFAASSTNAQPWHFILASSNEAKAKIAKATQEPYHFNTQAVLDASNVVVFCCRTSIEENYLLCVLAQEEKDGRFAADPALKERMHGGRRYFVGLHKNELNDMQQWMGKQTYLNLGAFLLGVSTLGIDAVPMEGVDTKVLDKEFGLAEKGYTSLVIVPIGYSDPQRDHNAALPKSRLDYSEILTEI